MVVSELLLLQIKALSLGGPVERGSRPLLRGSKKKKVTADLLTAIDFTRWESESAETEALNSSHGSSTAAQRHITLFKSRFRIKATKAGDA